MVTHNLRLIVHYIFHKKDDKMCTFILIFGNYISKINKGNQAKVNIKNLRKLKYFLKIELSYLKERIHLSQRKYVLDLLDQYGMLGSKLSLIPIYRTVDLHDKESVYLRDPTIFRRLVGN